MSYPLVSPPSTDTGALTWPRRLQKWLDVNPDTRLTRTSTFITLPTFNQGANTWNGYSDIVASFNYESPNNISLTQYVPPVLSNYACTISYCIGSSVTRYLLWNAIGSMLPGYILPYNGQVLLKNFRIEIWNTSQGISSENNGITIYTSKLGGVDYRYGIDSALVGNDGINTSFQDLLPGNPVNPLGVFDDIYLASTAVINVFGIVTMYSAIGNVILQGSGSINTNTSLVQFNNTGSYQATTGSIGLSEDVSQIFIVSEAPGGVYRFGPTTGNNYFDGGPTGAHVITNGIINNAYTLNGIVGSAPGLTISIISIIGSNWNLSTFDMNGNLLSSSTQAVNFSIFDTDSTFQITLSNICNIFCCGYCGSNILPQTLANYLISKCGYNLPLTFPVGSYSKTN